MPSELREIHLDLRRKENVERVVGRGGGAAMQDFHHVKAFADDSFGQQEAGGELPVMARRAHRHRHASALHADFQRLFDGEGIGFGFRLETQSGAQHGGLNHGVARHGCSGTGVSPVCFSSHRRDACATTRPSEPHLRFLSLLRLFVAHKIFSTVAGLHPFGATGSSFSICTAVTLYSGVLV